MHTRIITLKLYLHVGLYKLIDIHSIHASYKYNLGLSPRTDKGKPDGQSDKHTCKQ